MYIKYLLNLISKTFKVKHTWNCCGQKAYTDANLFFSSTCE